MILAPLVLSMLVSVPRAQAVAPPVFRPRAYGYALSMLSLHQGNGQTYHRVADRLSGHAWGLGGGAGGFITRSIGLEVEFLYGGKVTAPQRFSYTTLEDYVAENRDISLTELLRIRPRGTSRVDYLVGGGFVRTIAGKSSIVYSDYSGRRYTAPGYTESYNGATIGGGVDITIPAGARTSIAPTARMRWIKRPAGGSSGWNGIGEFALQFGASVLFQ